MINQNNAINIGAGATVSGQVVIAGRIEGSINIIKDAAIASDLKEILTELLERVSSVSKSSTPEQADAMSRDAKTLTEEVSSPKPRRAFLDVTIQGLKDAAIAVGEVGKPILETVSKLLPLIGGIVGA